MIDLAAGLSVERPRYTIGADGGSSMGRRRSTLSRAAARIVAFGLAGAVSARAEGPAPSLVRFLLYSNQWDVEGLVATTSDEEPGPARRRPLGPRRLREGAAETCSAR
jgi:hypothetical protein